MARVKSYSKTTGLQMIIVVLIFLLILAIGLMVYYFVKIDPKLKQLDTIQKTELDLTKNNSTCTKAYDKDRNLVYCWDLSKDKPTKSEALAECSTSANKGLDVLAKSSKTFSELDKGRDFLIKICMQGKGFDY